MKIKLHQDLLSQELSRKQFLQLAGAAILSVIGFTAFINNINKFANTRSASTTSKQAGSDYGNSAYGL